MEQVKVLIATDLSENSLQALKVGAQLAKEVGGQITLVHCVEPPLSYPPSLGVPRLPTGPGGAAPQGPSARPMEASLEDMVRYNLERWCNQHLPGAGASAVLLTHESPARAICKYAKDQGTDWLVVSTHGRTGIAAMLIGSVAERIVRHAPCNVVVARTAAGAEE